MIAFHHTRPTDVSTKIVLFWSRPTTPEGSEETNIHATLYGTFLFAASLLTELPGVQVDMKNNDTNFTCTIHADTRQITEEHYFMVDYVVAKLRVYGKTYQHLVEYYDEYMEELDKYGPHQSK